MTKRKAGSPQPRYTGGIGTAVISKPGGPVITLGGSNKPKAGPTKSVKSRRPS